MKLLAAVLCLIVSSGVCQDVSNQEKIHNKFSIGIYKNAITENDNLFISPFSIRIALLAASEGARGETKRQFDRLIGNFADSKEFLDELSGKKENIDFGFLAQNKLEIANAIWTNETVHVKPEFIHSLQEKFNSEQFSFDPKNLKQAQVEADNWVKEKTHGRITNMMGPSDLDACVIANAVYFKDRWAQPFKEKKTKPRAFYTIDGRKQDVQTMYSVETFEYFEDEDLQALTMGYESQFKMIVLLPRKNDGLRELERKMDEDLFSTIVSNSSSHPVHVFFPKFTLTSEVAFPGSDDEMLGTLFSSTADYSGIADDRRTQLNTVLHKTFIEVNEKRTEATAFTEVVVVGAAGGGDPPPPPEPKVFRADHPFIFVIADKLNQGIVFVGRFVKPESTK